jgi:lipoate-protein ligase A
MKLDLYKLGLQPWQTSQSVYHALAHLGREGLCLVEPASPYVCLGYHQDASKELDWETIRRDHIPVFRREVGGGAVYLDRGQLFYQFVLRAGDPRFPRDRMDLFRFLLQPVIDTLREFGVPAEFKPVNDILANGKKISGNGAAEINGMTVVVGNFLLDFPYERMAAVLRVPDEKFRDKVFKTLEANLTTIPRVTGGPAPSAADLSERFLARCRPLFGGFERRGVDGTLRERAEQIAAEYSAPDWVRENDRREQEGRTVKIAPEIAVVERLAKYAGGLVRASAVVDHGFLHGVHLSGDFFFHPANRLAELEGSLEGADAEPKTLTGRIRSFFRDREIRMTGIEPEDLGALLASLSST